MEELKMYQNRPMFDVAEQSPAPVAAAIDELPVLKLNTLWQVLRVKSPEPQDLETLGGYVADEFLTYGREINSGYLTDRDGNIASSNGDKVWQITQGVTPLVLIHGEVSPKERSALPKGPQDTFTVLNYMRTVDIKKFFEDGLDDYIDRTNADLTDIH